MNPDTPTTAKIWRAGLPVTADFATCYDATGFVHAQARAATAATEPDFGYAISTSDGQLIAGAAHGPNIAEQVVAALAELDTDGFTRMHVPGHTALIYAHRSQCIPGALLIGVDADEDQRILFAVNDADLVDTTVGRWTGATNTAPTGAGFQVTCEVLTPTAFDADRIVQALASSQPVQFGPVDYRQHQQVS